MPYEPTKAYELMRELVKTVAPQVSVPAGFLPKLQEYAGRLPTYETKDKAQEGLGKLLKDQHIPDDEGGKLLRNVLGGAVDAFFPATKEVAKPVADKGPDVPRMAPDYTRSNRSGRRPIPERGSSDDESGPILPGSKRYPKGTLYAVVSPKDI